MASLLPFIPIALLALACPLMMVGMGVGTWLVARARGEKKELSMGCMGGSCNHEGHAQQPAANAEATNLQQEVARLQGEVEGLKSRFDASRTGDGHNGTAPLPPGVEKPGAPHSQGRA